MNIEPPALRAHVGGGASLVTCQGASEALILIEALSIFLYASIQTYTLFNFVCQGGGGRMSEMEQKESEYIWIQDAQKEFKRSQAWFYQQIKRGVLTKYTLPGDIHIYLSRKELKELFQFRPASKPKASEK
jgi:hypothetical protein